LDASCARIPAHYMAFWIKHVDRIVLDAVEQQAKPFLTFVQRLFASFAFGNVGADGNVLSRFSISSDERNDCRIYPVDRTIFGPVLDLGVPNFSIRDAVVHLLEKLFGVVAGVENAVILADQFIF